MDELKKRLVSKKEDLEKQLEIYKSEDPFLDTDKTIANTFEDDISDAEGHDRIVATRRQLKQSLAEVNEALDKISKGTYGICDSCGKKINRDRLEVLPRAKYCLECDRKGK